MIGSVLLLYFFSITDILALLLGAFIGFFISSFLKKQLIRHKNTRRVF